MKRLHSHSWRGIAEMVRRTATAAGRQQSGRYTIEGARLVERALRAGVPLEHVLIGESYAGSADPHIQQLLRDLAAANCLLTTAPDSALTTLTLTRNLGPILALAPLPLSQLTIENSQLTINPSLLLLIALDLTDPGNTGALIRTAHAAGATAFVAAGRTDPYHPRAVQTSRGSLFKLPLLHYKTAAVLFHDLHQHAITTVGAVTGNGTALPTIRFPSGPLAVFVGNEGQGLPTAIHAAFDLHVTIPMPPGIDSFAVNAAAAIILYAARHQAQ